MTYKVLGGGHVSFLAIKEQFTYGGFGLSYKVLAHWPSNVLTLPSCSLCANACYQQVTM